MSESNSNSIDRNKLIKRIGIVAAALFVIYYVCYNVFTATVDTVFTSVITNVTVNKSIDAEIFAVREENYIVNSASGSIIPVTEDGSRVSKGDSVVMVFPNESDAALYTEIQSTKSEIKRFESLASFSETTQTNIAKTDGEIRSVLESLVGTVGSGKVIGIGDYADTLRDKIIKRRLLIGDKIPLDEKVFELNLKLKTLEERQMSGVNVTAPDAGYFIGNLDGYEKTLSCDNIDELTAAQVEAAIAAEPGTVPNGAIGKLVSSFDWYMVCVIDSKFISELEDIKRVDVSLPNSSVGTINAKINRTKLEGDKALVVLKCNLMNADIANLRCEQAELVLGRISGFKIPVDAVREEKGVKGVYVRRSNTVSFRAIDILYTARDFVIVDSEGSNVKGTPLKVYDEIVVKGKDLYDGKVLK